MSQTNTAIVARNTTYQFLAKAITMVLSMVTFSLVARFLSVEQYGAYTLVSTIFSLVIGFSDIRIEQVVVRDIAEDEGKIPNLITQSTVARFCFALALSAVTFIVIYASSYTTEVKVGISIALFGVLFTALHSGFQSTIQYYLKAYLLTFAEVVAKVAIAALIGIVFLMGMGDVISQEQALPLFVLIALVVSPLVVLLAFAYWSFKDLHISFAKQINWQTIKYLVIQSWPLWIMGLLSLIHYRADTLILSFYKPTYDVGIYGVAYRFLDVAVTLPPLFTASVYPLLSRYVVSDKEKAKGVMVKSFNFMFIFVILLAVGTFYAAPQVVTLFGGEGYEQSIDVLKILSIAMIGSYLSGIFVPYLIALRTQRYAIQTLAISIIINLSLSIALIPKYSYIGAATATAISEMIGFILLGGLVAIKYQLQLNYASLGKALLSALAMLAVLWATGLNAVTSFKPLDAGLSLLYIGAIGLAVYTIGIVGLRAVDKDVMEHSLSMLPIPNKIKKLIHG